jgi:hypothetical protein
VLPKYHLCGGIVLKMFIDFFFSVLNNFSFLPSQYHCPSGEIGQGGEWGSWGFKILVFRSSGPQRNGWFFQVGSSDIAGLQRMRLEPGRFRRSRRAWLKCVYRWLLPGLGRRRESSVCLPSGRGRAQSCKCSMGKKEGLLRRCLGEKRTWRTPCHSPLLPPVYKHPLN